MTYYVPRERYINEVVKFLYSNEHYVKESVSSTLMLCGIGGFGKTTLAISICSTEEIRETFKSGFIFIELGPNADKPTNILC